MEQEPDLNISKMQVLVVDDEPLARARLIKMLGAFASVTVAGEAAHGLAALEICSNKSIDLVLLDVEMPGMTGLDVAEQLLRHANRPAVIFCTAYDDFALEAFDRAAVDYLLKPVNASRLEVALAKAKALSDTRLAKLRDLRPEAQEDHYIWIKSPKGKQRLDLSQVRVLQAEAKYVTAITDSAELLLEGSLASWEERLGEQFVRIHRSTLVALQHFAGWEKSPSGGYRAIIDGVTVRPTISRRHMPKVQMRFKQM